MTPLLRGIAIGFLAGVLFTGALVYFFGQRYTVSSAIGGFSAIKLDTWTGRTWMQKYYPSPDNSNVKIFYWEALNER